MYSIKSVFNWTTSVIAKKEIMRWFIDVVFVTF